MEWICVYEDFAFVTHKEGAQNMILQAKGADTSFAREILEGRGLLGCSPKHPLSSHDQVLVHCHSILGQLDHLMGPKDQGKPRQSNQIIHKGQ